MKPSIGRIVMYRLSESDRWQNNGQPVAAAVVTAVWGDTCVNLRVLCDGPHTEWKTSAVLGNEPGQWSWPERA